MPSRRKSAHTTKIERVPRFEVYHGEEDIDDRLGSDGSLDLSMKRVKVEPIDYSESSTHSGRSPPSETDAATAETSEAGIEAEEMVEGSASSYGANEAMSVADDSNADASSTSDHVSVHIDVPSSTVDCATDDQLIVDSNAPALTTANGLQLFGQTAKGKTVRPFKLYTTNRDLLSGLSTQGAPTLATFPVALSAAGTTGTVPLAFSPVPLVTGAPMIPQTSAASSTSASSSAAAMGADTDTITSSTSSPTSNTTAKSTSSTTDAHLMTLATEADKILRERHESGESSTGSGLDSLEGNTADTLTSNGSEEHDSAMASEAEDGTVLKIPVLSSKTSNGDPDSLTFIQKRAVAAAVAATTPSKSKKKRLTLPDQMKDLAYWERRRKNNEAAKRSRDARRAKEDQIAIRAALLEQENIRLKIEVNALKEETAKLRSMLYANNNK